MTTDALKKMEQITGKKLTLGNCLWSIRLCDEYTQAGLAQKLGVSRQYLCDVEKGRKKVSPKKAGEFAEKLGYSPLQFIALAIQDALLQDGMHFTVELGVEKNRVHWADFARSPVTLNPSPKTQRISGGIRL